MAWIQWDTERDYSQTEYGKNALVVGESEGGGREHPDSSGDDSRRRCARDDGVVNQPLARDDGVTGGYRARLKSESIWEEGSGGLRIAMLAMLIQGAREDCTMVNGDHLQGTMPAGIRNDTAQDYS
jgi:hypothetical protein